MLPSSNRHDLPLQQERYQPLQTIISILLNFLQDTNTTEWNNYIQQFLNLEAKDGQNEDLEANLTQAVETEITHFERVKSFGRASQHNRNVEPFNQFD